jgi:CheY-like chemotaxis protein
MLPAMPAENTRDLRRTVLYIEDNPVNLKLMTQILSRRPHIDLLTAHAAAPGVELAEAHRPDLILLDINMPEMDGYQVLQSLQAHPILTAIPVICRQRQCHGPRISHAAKRRDFRIM